MMKNITIVTGLATATIAGVLALSACSTTTEDIHNSAAEKGSLDVPLPYSVVYEDVAEFVGGCIPTGALSLLIRGREQLKSSPENSVALRVFAEECRAIAYFYRLTSRQPPQAPPTSTTLDAVMGRPSRE